MVKLIAFDLETTGIDPFYDVPVSYQLGDKSGYINPGRPIPEQAIAIHGITNAMVADADILEDGIVFLGVTLSMHWMAGYTVIGMNVSCDLTMVASQLQRFGYPPLVVGPVIDVLVIDRTFDKYRKGSRKLSALCEHYGVVLENAHTASADAQACIEIYEKQVAKWPKLAEITNHRMAEWYVRWLTGYAEWCTKNDREPIPKGRYSWPVHTNES